MTRGEYSAEEFLRICRERDAYANRHVLHNRRAAVHYLVRAAVFVLAMAVIVGMVALGVGGKST